jgi:hypothetical protein
MSLYTQGAGGTPIVVPSRTNQRRVRVMGADAFVPPPVLMNVTQDSGFWTLIKWLGAGLTLWVGYEKIREFYDRKLKDQPDEDGETTPEGED